MIRMPFSVTVAVGIGHVCICGAFAQTPINVDPHVLRPPFTTDASAEARIAGLVQLFSQELTKVLQHGDTVSLAVLVPDGLIPSTERNASAQLGCRSLSDAVVRLQSGWGQAFMKATRALPLSLVTVSTTVNTTGDTVAVASARVRNWIGDSPNDVVTFVLVRDRDAVRMARTWGLLLALCKLAVPPL